ncbi:RHS repeat-associated core domain-containing protein [Stenotrophomonas bentonitica]|uniref:RHS repeat-associated core domain-containing protein n=1 Tax=Stenotrophomonas bentonitica TaxID=1450134 RepID=UPI00345EDAEB
MVGGVVIVQSLKRRQKSAIWLIPAQRAKLRQYCVAGNVRRTVNCGTLGLLLAIASGSPWTVLSASAAERLRYVHTDALGSPVAVTDGSGAVVERRSYEPYGTAVGTEVKGGPGFTGHVRDTATGLTYVQQRYLDTDLGVFLSVDPVGASVAPVAMFNRYRYANGNPYTLYDPDGRCTGSRVTNDDGTCKISGSMTTMSPTASSGRSGAKAVSVPDSIKVESQGYPTASDAAKAAGNQYGEIGVKSKRELQLGLTKVASGDWGYLTPGWGPEDATRVDPAPLLQAYEAAGFRVDAWMHGHFDSQLNFSATDFTIVWGRSWPTFMVNRNGTTRVLTDSYLKGVSRSLPFQL